MRFDDSIVEVAVAAGCTPSADGARVLHRVTAGRNDEPVGGAAER